MPSIREYPATVVAVPVAVLALVYSVLTPTNVVLGLITAAVIPGFALVLDRITIPFRTPDEYRATILVVPIVLLLGIYTVLTPTNVLIWVFAAFVLLGTGLLVDLLPSDDDSD